jgi:hypothetical protein
MQGGESVLEPCARFVSCAQMRRHRRNQEVHFAPLPSRPTNREARTRPPRIRPGATARSPKRPHGRRDQCTGDRVARSGHPAPPLSPQGTVDRVAPDPAPFREPPGPQRPGYRIHISATTSLLEPWRPSESRRFAPARRWPHGIAFAPVALRRCCRVRLRIATASLVPRLADDCFDPAMQKRGPPKPNARARRTIAPHVSGNRPAAGPGVVERSRATIVPADPVVTDAIAGREGWRKERSCRIRACRRRLHGH